MARLNNFAIFCQTNFPVIKYMALKSMKMIVQH